MRLATCLLLTAFASLSFADTTEEACRQLIMDYAWYRDHPDADTIEAYGALFTEDAELSILGETYKGRAAIRDRLTASTGSTVHLMSTMRITPVSEVAAVGTSYVTVYSAPPGAGSHEVSGYAAIGEYQDEFRKTSDGWKIAKRVLVMRLRDANYKPAGSH